MNKKIFCETCNSKVLARLTKGLETYNHRPDLHELPFWICDTCGNFVGCHHKTKTPTKPLGIIASPQTKYLRRKIHAIIDPVWKSGEMSRSDMYRKLSAILRKPYHTGKLTYAEAEYILDRVTVIYQR